LFINLRYINNNVTSLGYKSYGHVISVISFHPTLVLFEQSNCIDWIHFCLYTITNQI